MFITGAKALVPKTKCELSLMTYKCSQADGSDCELHSGGQFRFDFEDLVDEEGNSITTEITGVQGYENHFIKVIPNKNFVGSLVEIFKKNDRDELVSIGGFGDVSIPKPKLTSGLWAPLFFVYNHPFKYTYNLICIVP